MIFMAQEHHLPLPRMEDNKNPVVPPGLVVPIDSNISLLAAAGVLLGVYYLRIKK
ncbi:MAG TPA: hypothetical protein VK941_09525 [Gillisia sp.]|nr:hypothetical protein [Gillisia sp.]